MSERALVVGGASGIGAATASLLHERGWSVAIADIDRAATEQMTSNYSGMEGVHLDVTDPVSVESGVAAAVDSLGGLDSLIVCAGISDAAPTADTPPDRWRRLMAINLDGGYYTVRASVDALRQSGHGTVVMMSSVAARLGMPRRASYCASKGAVEALVRSFAVEFAPEVRVNAVAPGYVRTQLVAEALENGRVHEDDIVSNIPTGRMAEPIELARCIAFLASRESSFITGQVMVVDGGMTINTTW